MEEELERDMKPRLIGDLGMGYPTEKSSRKYRYGLYECQYCGKEFETISKSANIVGKSLKQYLKVSKVVV